MIDHFGILAPLYETLIKPKNPVNIIKLSNLPVDGPILDLGGGTGRISQFLTSMGESVIIADVSMKMLRQSKSKTGLKPVCLESEKLPFPDKYFSRVIMVDALHHVNNQSETIREICRVLNDDGIALIEEPDLNHKSIKVLALMEKMLLMQSKFLYPDQIASIFSSNNCDARIEVDGYIAWVIAKKQ